MQTSEQDLHERLGGEWRQSLTHPLYFFSRDGRAARYGGKVVRLLCGGIAGAGYRSVALPDGSVYVHREVCALFNGPQPPDKPHCRHLDGNPANNDAGNLAWGTRTENQLDRRQHGTGVDGEMNPMAKLTRAQVAEMRAIRSEQKTPYSRIAARFNVSTMTAHRAITGRTWQ